MSDVVLTDPIAGPAGAPHLAFPFEVIRTGNRIGARTVEQNSIDEIAQCVYAALATESGERDELPDYGMADPTFAGVDFEELREVLATFEPRAEFLTDDQLQGVIEMTTVGLI